MAVLFDQTNSVLELQEWYKQLLLLLRTDSNSRVYNLSLKNVFMLVLFLLWTIIIATSHKIIRFLYGLTSSAHHNISIEMSIILDRILKNVKQDDLVHIPVRKNQFFIGEIFNDPNIDSPIENGVFKGP